MRLKKHLLLDLILLKLLNSLLFLAFLRCKDIAVVYKIDGSGICSGSINSGCC
jgi:hypothetical protein